MYTTGTPVITLLMTPRVSSSADGIQLASAMTIHYYRLGFLTVYYSLPYLWSDTMTTCVLAVLHRDARYWMLRCS